MLRNIVRKDTNQREIPPNCFIFEGSVTSNSSVKIGLPTVKVPVLSKIMVSILEERMRDYQIVDEPVSDFKGWSTFDQNTIRCTN